SGPGALRGFRQFRAEARELFQALNPRFIEAPRAGPLAMARRFPPELAMRLMALGPMSTLWQRLGRHFSDPRLRQLYARYATYCGSSPFQAPGLLSLVAHVEAEGVWLIRGGMHALARQMAVLAQRLGVDIHYGCAVRRIEAENGTASAIHLADGRRRPARAIIFNGDAQALATGLLGGETRRAVPLLSPGKRSLSALVWSMIASAEGMPLSRHTVLFPDAYRPEFEAIFGRSRLPEHPTVYICAQDRDAADGPAPRGPERLHIHVNAPASGDVAPLNPEEIERCTQAMTNLAARAGVSLTPTVMQITTPERFHHLFPATGGALYGPANHGLLGSFRRMGAASRVPGLYLAGGSVHPGPGVPMAAMSGRLAAAQLAQDLGLDWDRASTRKSRKEAISGGISTGSRTAGATA
ncbi:MAG: FAD-dependent oxidoreductase, partial [Pseudomonadota bacterium]